MSDYSSLIFYVIAFILSASIVGYGIKRGYKVAIALGLALPIAISRLKFGVGTDYTSYVQTFKVINGLGLSEFLRNFGDKYEIGIYALARIASLFPYELNIFFGLFSFGTLVFLYLGLKRYKLPYIWLVILLYLFVLFPTSLNLVRQMLAASIFFYATSLIHQKKLWKYVLLVAFAGLFHKSALLLLPVYFLGKAFSPMKILRSRSMVVIGIVLSLLIVAGPPIVTSLLNISVFEKYDKYQTISQPSAGIVLTAKLATLGIITIFLRRIRQYPYFAFFYIMTTIEVLVLILGLSSIDLSRFSIYFSIFPLILLTYIARTFDKRSRFIIFTIIILYSMLFFWASYLLKGGSEIFPYQFLINRESI